MLDRFDRNDHTIGLPAIDAAHKSEHATLRATAESLRTRLPQAGPLDAARTLDVADYLRLRLPDHILVNDKPYRPFLMRLT